MRRSISQLIIPLLFLLPVTASAKNYWQGPAGGTGGYYFSKTVASHERICGVYVRHGARIDAIQLKICDSNGNSYRSQRFGGSGGTESFFSISSNEYLSDMVVYSGYRNGGNRVFGLKLYKENIGSGAQVISPLYGSTPNSEWIDGGGHYHNQPDPILFRMPGIVGIFGRSAGELDAIGLVYSQNQLDNNLGLWDSVGGSVGGRGGSDFDTFRFEGKICKIDIRHASRIDALRFKDCRDDGSAVYTPLYGGTGGSLSSFTLKSGEYLTSIRGSLVTRDGGVDFSSIQFFTNLRTSPIYGQDSGRSFRLDIPAGKSPGRMFTRSGNSFASLRLFAD